MRLPGAWIVLGVLSLSSFTTAQELKKRKSSGRNFLRISKRLWRRWLKTPRFADFPEN